MAENKSDSSTGYCFVKETPTNPTLVPIGVAAEKVLDKMYTYSVSLVDELIALLERLRNDWLRTHGEVRRMLGWR